MSEMKPCPFCGDERLKIEAGCHVRCKSCCADGPVYEYDDGSDDPESRIIGLWNTRADPIRQPAQALLDKLDEAMPAINYAIGIATIHHHPYTGPSFGGEIEALRGALRGTLKEAGHG